MKYKKGDIIRIRKDLVDGQKYGDATFVKDMSPYLGTTITISKVYKTDDIYASNGWSWTDEMLEPQKVDNWKKRIENE